MVVPSVNFVFCAQSKPAIFSTFALTWTTLDQFTNEQMAGTISISPYIGELSLRDPSSWGEWNKNITLGDLILVCPNLTSLTVASSGSSSWLKYINNNVPATKASSKLKKISVVSRVALDNRGLPDNNDLKLPSFNIHDLAHFENMDTLHLEGFNVRNEKMMEDFEDQTQVVGSQVQTLSLKNCIWEYPFEVQDFGMIRHLTVIFTDCYRSFTCKFMTSAQVVC